jgi:hypothetical protein
MSRAKHSTSNNSEEEIDSARVDNLSNQIRIPRDVYKNLVDLYPPNPLYPKTYGKEESPKAGGL